MSSALFAGQIEEPVAVSVTTRRLRRTSLACVPGRLPAQSDVNNPVDSSQNTESGGQLSLSALVNWPLRLGRSAFGGERGAMSSLISLLLAMPARTPGHPGTQLRVTDETLTIDTGLAPEPLR